MGKQAQDAAALQRAIKSAWRKILPSLTAWFLNEFNAPNALILPLSRRRIITAPQGDGEGAKACDLRGLGVRSSG